MIKRGYAIIALGALAAASIIGLGFAFWDFTDGAEAEHNFGVHITQSSELGFFSAPQIKYAVLDGGTGSGINPTITGISFYKTETRGQDQVAVTDNTFNITFTVSEVYADYIVQGDNADTIKFGIKIDVPAPLSDTIEHTPFYNERLGDNGYIDLKALAIELTDHFDDPSFEKSDFSFDAETRVFTFAMTTTTLNRFFTYKADKVPDTLDKQKNIPAVNYASQFTIELWQG